MLQKELWNIKYHVILRIDWSIIKPGMLWQLVLGTFIELSMLG